MSIQIFVEFKHGVPYYIFFFPVCLNLFPTVGEITMAVEIVKNCFTEKREFFVMKCISISNHIHSIITLVHYHIMYKRMHTQLTRKGYITHKIQRIHISVIFQTFEGPTSSAVVLRSKLVDGRCQVRSPVALVDLAVRSFLWFSPKLS